MADNWPSDQLREKCNICGVVQKCHVRIVAPIFLKVIDKKGDLLECEKTDRERQYGGIKLHSMRIKRKNIECNESRIFVEGYEADIESNTA